MKKEVLYEIKAIYRDDFRVTGYTFGEGEKALCIVGSMRGNENQQLYCCSRLVARLRQLEEEGRLIPGKQILVIPCANPYSINTKKRFWCTDNTDINRMFPGYALGETTQRIAAGVFDAIKGWQYGIQFASFYMPGTFVPHIRMMDTGYQDTELACEFGLPYVVVQKPRPFDTATLNYNWQIWETQAFSLYTHETECIDPADARQAVDAILRFLAAQGLSRQKVLAPAVPPVLFREGELHSVISAAGGLLLPVRWPGDRVRPGDVLGEIVDPCTCTVLETLRVDCSGQVFFLHHAQLISGHEVAFRILPEG